MYKKRIFWVILFFVIVLLCSCASVRNIAYVEYEHSIDLFYLNIENFFIPVFEISINNNNYHAIFHTGYYKNIINKSILYELGIEVIDGKTDVTIPQIILANGIVLHDTIFHVVEPNDDVIKIYFGLSAFKEYNVLVSYRRNKIFLYNSNTIPSYLTSWVPVTVAFPGEGLYIFTVVRGSNKTYLTWLASGTTLFIGGMFNRHYNIGLDMRIPVATFFRSSIYIGGQRYRLRFFNSFSANEIADMNMEGSLTDLILGYAFFKHYDIFIPSNNRRIYLQRP